MRAATHSPSMKVLRPIDMRAVPAALAAAGLAVPLAASHIAALPLAATCAAIACLAAWLLSRPSHDRDQLRRVVLGVALIPVLLLLGWEGGRWLLPADVAWVVIEIVDDDPRWRLEAERPSDARLRLPS